MEKWYLDKGFDSNSKHAECWRLDVLLLLVSLSLSLSLSLRYIKIGYSTVHVDMYGGQVASHSCSFHLRQFCSVDVCLHPTFQVFPESCNENVFVDRKWLSVPR